ncbi:T9SS type A sorting domain-containing protein [Saccharicrinis sp. FJH2]|uniref:T9SS type A sorting domain-containing protein n=1 Tax=Saccharicrinis sp. FJH65 TaxID=3344659 RepID=UPI0035F37D5B
MQKDLNHIFEQAKNQKPLIPFQTEKVDKAMANAKSRRQPKLRFNHQGLPKNTILNLRFFTIMTGIALLISLVTVFSPTQQKTENETYSVPQIDFSEVISDLIPEDEIMKEETELDEDKLKKDLEPISENTLTQKKAEINNSTKEKKERLTCKIEDVAEIRKTGRVTYMPGSKLDSAILEKIPVLNSNQIENLGFTNFINGTVYFNKDSSGYYRTLISTGSYNFDYHQKMKPTFYIDSIPQNTNNDFYPAYVVSFKPLIYRKLVEFQDIKNMELAPVKLPAGTNHYAKVDLIAFFVPNDKFWDIVESQESQSNKDNIVLHELKVKKSANVLRKEFISSINKIVLDSSGLLKLGFQKRMISDTTIWTYHTNYFSSMFLFYNDTINNTSSTKTGWSQSTTEKEFNSDGTYNFRPFTGPNSYYRNHYYNFQHLTLNDLSIRPQYACTTNGMLKYADGMTYYEKENFNTDSLISNVNNLVPIFISWNSLGYTRSSFKSSRVNKSDGEIFWFEPSEELFSRLPDSIANELRKEYNINVLGITDNKTEKAECKFFQAYCTPIPGVGIIDLFPNPANDVINITIPHTEDNELTIQAVDLSGKRTGIHKKISLTGTGEETVEVNIGELQPGMYLFVFSNQDGMSHSLRFIKN